MFYLNLSEEERDQFMARFGVKRFLTSYGMTETIVGLIGDRPGDMRRWPSIGRPGFCYQAQIRDRNNQPVGTGVIGELCVKVNVVKPSLKSITTALKRQQKPLTKRDGCIRVTLLPRRRLFLFVDRSSNMIKRGGENVSCSEIENIIASHPAIVDVAVIGIVDDIRDEAIKAYCA